MRQAPIELRRLHRLDFFVGTTLQKTSEHFDEWGFDTPYGVHLLGRFSDGRWVALQQHPVDYSADDGTLTQKGVHAFVDTALLIIGRSADVPSEFAKLLPTRSVVVVEENSVTPFTLSNDYSPAMVAVCDSGVVVVDTSGIKYINASGHINAALRLPVRRTHIDKNANGGVVNPWLDELKDATNRSAVKTLLNSWASGVDSTLNVPSIDAEGHVWFADPTSSTMMRFDRAGHFDRAFEHGPGPIAAAHSLMLARIYDKETREMPMRVLSIPLPKADAGPSVGWCAAAKRN